MIYICKHEDDIAKAWDTKEILENHALQNVEMLFKVQSYNRPGKRREHRTSYIISASTERRQNAV